VRGDLGGAGRAIGRGLRFLTSADDYWCFEAIARMEEEHDLRSRFHVYGGPGGRRRTPKEMLMDPAYDVASERVARTLRTLAKQGWEVGLHPSFDAWEDEKRIGAERRRVEEAVGAPVTTVRQHWLRFSWDRTWEAQERAGLSEDATLAWNDRPGFRTGAALRFHPWCEQTGEGRKIRAMPTVLMDSHLFDYADLTEAARRTELLRWIDEVRTVRGVASVIWHQRVMSRDYGWGPTYEFLLDELGELAT